jgi:hypothetical protein
VGDHQATLLRSLERGGRVVPVQRRLDTRLAKQRHARLHSQGSPAPAKAEDAAAEAIRHADQFLAEPKRATLLHGLKPRTGEPRYSTPELLAVEARLIDAAVAGVGIGRAVVAPQTLQAAIARRTAAILDARPGFAWRAEQLAMIGHLTTSGNAVDAVIGVAGAGKTTALAVVNDAFTAAGYRVVGAALADQGPSSSLQRAQESATASTSPGCCGSSMTAATAGSLPTPC